MSPTDALANELGRALHARGYRVATAESCTGGLVAAAITSVPGSSAWFERGFVTYSNEAKCAMLGVPAGLIDAQGAVSEAVACAMAAGAVANSEAECALSVTGIAGPDGGTATKPLGLVCLAWAVPGAPPVVATRHFPGDRTAVRAAATDAALEGLIRLLEAGPRTVG